jgi:ParB family chromosome partitioning protein
MAQITLKKLATGREDLFILPYEALAFEPGFNARADEGEIEGLAKSIAQLGMLDPLRVRIGKDEEGKVKAFITDGHRRYKALPIAVEKFGAQKSILENIKVIQEEEGSNDADRTIGLLVLNSGKALEPLEQAEVFFRLKKFGWTVEKIASAAGKTQKFVHTILGLRAVPSEIREAVKTGNISATAAIELSKAEPAVQRKILNKAAVIATKGEELVSGAVVEATAPKKKVKIRIKDVQKEVKGTPDTLSTKSLKDIRDKVSKIKSKADEPSKACWDAVLYGIDLCLGEELNENRY